LNLAASDVGYLADALIAYYQERGSVLLETYSERALARIWRAERFSWWLTTLLHRFPEHDEFDRRMQHAELEHLVGSRSAQAAFTEAYIGLSP
jgi:p-hydroxybenzoate 3-monooxygenase